MSVTDAYGKLFTVVWTAPSGCTCEYDLVPETLALDTIMGAMTGMTCCADADSSTVPVRRKVIYVACTIFVSHMSSASNQMPGGATRCCKARWLHEENVLWNPPGEGGALPRAQYGGPLRAGDVTGNREKRGSPL